MTMARSPRYPIIGLAEAIDKAEAIYRRDYQNKIPKQIVAQHMGYQSLNGKSLGVVSALSKYGLLEGGSDEMWVTDRALTIIGHAPGDPERSAALREAAGEPEVFSELDSQFPEKASDAAIRSYLIVKRKFLPDGADRLIRSYRETKDLIASECEFDVAPATAAASLPVESDGALAKIPGQSSSHSFSTNDSSSPTEGSRRREIFALDEGDVELIYPRELSAESYSDLIDYLRVFAKKLKRRVGATAGASDAEDFLKE